MYEATVALSGNAVSEVKHVITAEGHHLARFRMVVNGRRFDRTADRWVDTESSYYSVVAWRHVADNMAASISKGDPVVVMGRLRIREWERDGVPGVTAEIDAQALGHDLTRGRTRFERPVRANEGMLTPVAAQADAA